MQSEEKRTLTKIGKDERFCYAIKQLTIGKNLEPYDRAYILASAILFIRHYWKDKRYTSYADLAYYIILKYSLQYKDYSPLYDFTINFGFYPIAKDLIKNGLYDGNLITKCLGDFQLDQFRNKSDDTLTFEQYIESDSFLNDDSPEACYMAPTSFGKSSLIVDQIDRLGDRQSKIVILVPTKSLLIQTFHMIREAKLQRKLMIHDEMYNGEDSFIAIFTQERALRLLTKYKTCFDMLFVDEAHNLLKGDSRSVLLSRVIAMNRVLNPKQRVLYLSPLLKDANNLRLAPDQNISSHVVRFNIKEPEIYELRLNKEVYQYNRFVNQFYKLQEGIEIKDYLLSASGEKNFVYNYRPMKIEQLARELCSIIPQIESSDKINEVAKILAKEVHPDFYAINHLKHGIVYLHGKLPDLVKEYLESKYKEMPELKYVVANSVILEGMNLPIDTLFIFNTRSLEGKELMNLIGRVNRLNTIFGQEGNRLELLLPKVHFINNEEHYHGFKMENKIKLLRSRVFDDKVENPTLQSFDIESLTSSAKSKEKKFEKVIAVRDNEHFITSKPETTEDTIRAYLIQSGIIDFYSDTSEIVNQFISKLPALETNPPEWWVTATMMEKIEYLFLRDIKGVEDFEVSRLLHSEARSYYESHILIAQKKSLNENINSQVRYFKQKAASENSKMYIGRAFGEENYETQAYPTPNSNDVYVDLAKKTDRQLVNLAIIKLKMEDDFVSFKINKFIIMLFDFGLIFENEYNRYIYGTTDEKKIRLTKYGLSIGIIARLEKDGQLDNLEFDEFNNLRATHEFMEFLQTVSDFYRFEIRRYIG